MRSVRLRAPRCGRILSLGIAPVLAAVYFAVVGWLAMSGSLSAASVAVYLSPHGGAETAIIRAVDAAQARIDVAMYAFTNTEIEAALRKAAGRGIAIRLVADQGQAGAPYSVVPALSCLIPVRYNVMGGLMHDKYAIIDERRVITGSYNWTESAQKSNAENLLVIDNDPELVATYQSDFEHLWTAKSAPAPACAAAHSLAGGAGSAWNDRAGNAGRTESYPEAVQPVAPSVRLDVDRYQERATLTNLGDTALNLAGWTLLSVRGYQRFIFPPGVRLEPGRSITVLSGPKARTGAGALVWTTDYVWNNSGDTAQLIDPRDGARFRAGFRFPKVD